MRSTRELRDKATRDEEMTQLAINTIRTLAIDAVQQGRSQHPGTPMALGPLIVRSFDALRSGAPNGVIDFCDSGVAS